jgi:hypothetical protein
MFTACIAGLDCSSLRRALGSLMTNRVESTDRLAVVSDIPECAKGMAWVVSLDWLGLSSDLPWVCCGWPPNREVFLSPPPSDCMFLCFTSLQVSWCSMKLSTLCKSHSFAQESRLARSKVCIISDRRIFNTWNLDEEKWKPRPVLPSPAQPISKVSTEVIQMMCNIHKCNPDTLDLKGLG